MPSPAGHTALTADCSAPIFSGVLLLLALLGPQEEKAIVRQQNSETRPELVNLLIYILTASACGGLRSKISLSQKVSFPINWVTSRNSGTGDNQIVLFDAQRTQDRRLISYWDLDIPGDKRKLNTATDSSKVEFSSVKFKSDQGGDNLTADSVYLHLFDFLYMFNVHVSLTFKQGNWTIEVEIFWYSDRAIYGHIAIATQVLRDVSVW